VLGVVAGRDEEVCQDGELVLRQLLPVLRPVVLVRPLELLEDGLDGGWDGWWVVQVVGEGHEDGRQGGRDAVGGGEDEGGEAENAGVSSEYSRALLSLPGHNTIQYDGVRHLELRLVLPLPGFPSQLAADLYSTVQCSAARDQNIGVPPPSGSQPAGWRPHPR